MILKSKLLITSMSSSLWVDNYKPINSSDMGNKTEITKIKKWLNVFKTNKAPANFKNCLLISGSPGIGKTSSIHILLKEAGFNVRFNASELRTSKIISEKIRNYFIGKIYSNDV